MIISVTFRNLTCVLGDHLTHGLLQQLNRHVLLVWV